MKDYKWNRKRILRLVGKIILTLLLLFAVLVLVIRTPWAQNLIVSKITEYVSNTTNTKFEVEKVFITFSGNIETRGVYMEDKQGDTLLYAKELQLDLPIYPFLVKNELSIDDVNAKGFVANIKRAEDPDQFNFSFLLDAFATSPSDTTTTEPMRISLGDFYLEDWKFRYTDACLGTDIKLNLGRLNTDFLEFNLEKMIFEVDEFKLENTQIKYGQNHVSPTSNDTTTTTLPLIKVSDFKLNKVHVSYDSKPDALQTSFKLGNIALSDIDVDVSKSSYNTHDLLIAESNIDVSLHKVTDTTKIKDNSFEWPKIVLASQNIDLESNSITFSQNNEKRTDSVFNPSAFALNQLNFHAENFRYRPKNFHLLLKDASFQETSGIQLKQFAFEAGLTDNDAFIKDFIVGLNNSKANANMEIAFTSIQEALNSTQNSSIDLGLTDLNIEPSDIQKLVPQLKNNSYLDSLSIYPITGRLKANGTLKKVDELDTKLNWGDNTMVSINGTLSNLTQTDAFAYDLNNIDIKSINSDITKFISVKDLSIQVPKTIALNGSLKGTLETFETKSELQIPEGRINLNASASIGDTKQFKGLVKTDSLQLGNLLKNPQVGTISFEINGSAFGTELSNLDAEVNGEVTEFELNSYTYKNINLSGTIEKGLGDLNLDIEDNNLNFKTKTRIDLTSDINSVKFDANLVGADLRELGFTRNDIKIAGELQGDYNGKTNNYTIETHIKNAIAVTDNRQYQITPVNINAHIEDSITDVTIKSGFINGGLYSNASPNRINKALKQQLENYFSSDSTVAQNVDDVKAKLDLAIVPTPIISKVFFDGIEDLDSLNIDANFDAKSKNIRGKIFIPRFSYNKSTVDSLDVDLKGDSVNLQFSVGVAEFQYDPVHLKKTFLEGILKNKELVLDFNSINDTTEIMHISSELVFKKDTLTLHVSPDNLVLNKKQWEVPEDNKITLAESYSNFKNLIFSRNKQKLQVSTEVPAMKADHIGILFENFQLQTFLSLFNPDEALAKGVVQGNFVILNPYDASGLVSKMDINDFYLMQNPLGTLNLNASSKSFSDYDFDLVLKDGGADLRLMGDYTARQDDADLNFELDIQKLETRILEGFLKDVLSDPSGNISGSLLVNGTLSEPAYSGRLNFNNVGLTLSDYKTSLNINEQSLDLNEEEITLNSFKVKDSSSGTFTLDGKVITDNLFNPKFELSVKAEKFIILDSKKGDNELVYGKAVVDTDFEVSGNLELPVINGTLSIGDATNLTYLVPQTQYEIQEREGVVIFVNRENPDAILTKNTGETANSVFAGMDINTTLKISDQAIFTIVLDEKTQDKLQASGNATLNLNINPNQDIQLSGRLELNSGFYRTSLYNLVSREFKINEGSSVVWSGDPYNAKLDVTAIYELETSAAPLMSSISFGQDTGVSGQYQRSSTFLVYLNVGGEITSPELSFALDMPENAQGNYGGAVYGRIQQLNEQESELNKQVFSLLALNRFYPTTGSDGSNGGAIALARNNVNKVLSSELNSISNKILGNSGFELDFDLDSFQDYQGNDYQNRTQLNINAKKKLFDDRLIVTAGSAVDVEGSASNADTATPVIGNVSLEYLLTEEGMYRLKGFRRQEYQNIIDGQLIVTGLAFIFNREFNKFSQLFKPLKVETEEEKNTEEIKKQ